MKKKSNRPTLEGNANDGLAAPTVFDQLVVINCALSRELGVSPSEFLSKSTVELPGWCGNIIKQLGKTIFKPIRNLRPTGKVDWRNYGRLVASMERHKTFLVHDVPRILEEEIGDITEAQWKRIEPQLGLDNIRACLIKRLNRPVADDEPLEALADEALRRLLEDLENHRRVALGHVAQQGPKASALFYKGVGEGYALFMDEQANFCGDRGRTDIHLNLLACMLDVEKIRRTLPPTTRAQYYDNLTKVFKLTPKAYDWFSDVCDDIKFPLNNLGRKRQCPAAVL